MMLFALACELCGQARTTAQLDLRTHQGRTVIACTDIEDCQSERLTNAFLGAMPGMMDSADAQTWRRKQRRTQ